MICPLPVREDVEGLDRAGGVEEEGKWGNDGMGYDGFGVLR
jgi:hypothetical protein